MDGTWMSMDDVGKGFREMTSSIGYIDVISLLKNSVFYVLLTMALMQTFYPILMILAMVIRQLGIFAHFFYEVRLRCTRFLQDFNLSKIMC